MARIVAQFRAYVLDVRVDRALVALVRIALDSIQQIQRLENRYNTNPAGVNPGGMPMPAPVQP